MVVASAVGASTRPPGVTGHSATPSGHRDLVAATLAARPTLAAAAPRVARKPTRVVSPGGRRRPTAYPAASLAHGRAPVATVTSTITPAGAIARTGVAIATGGTGAIAGSDD